MGPSTHDAECAAVRDDLALLAVGTLTGRPRAVLLAHLDDCVRCVAELEELTAAADALVSLIPEATPPEGFAARVAASMHAERSASRRPVTRRVVAVAAVVIALAVGIGIGAVAASNGGGTGPPGGVRTASLQSASGAHGSVLLTSSDDGWLIMTIDDVSASTTVTCTVTLADGTRRTVGRFALTAGYGSWAAHLPVDVSEIRAVEVLDSTGATVASARIRS
jgi:hypothetical protein